MENLVVLSNTPELCGRIQRSFCWKQREVLCKWKIQSNVILCCGSFGWILFHFDVIYMSPFHVHEPNKTMVTLKGFPTGTLTFLIFDSALYNLKINWIKNTTEQVV